ncbi:helix-turn-helix transcriptional regulator [Camelimonas sp. ID_303_24]
MLSHQQIWQAIDGLAKRHGLSASGLARRAGLDPTTFNRSKRIAADGRLRWPSTESVAKVLDATGASIHEFLTLVDGDAGAAGARQMPQASSGPQPARPRGLPLIGMAQAGQGGYYDDSGYPVGSGFDEVIFPRPGDGSLYGLKVAGDSMLPVYRDGDVIVVDPAATVHKGDRVVARTRDGEVLAKELAARTTRVVRLRSLNPEHAEREIALKDLDWIARIVWASQ